MRVAHVTVYPPKGKKHISSSGVASYSKNLVTHIDDTVEQTVVTDKLDSDEDTYDDKGVHIRRVFSRAPNFIYKIHKALKNITPDVVHVQHELSLFGGPINAYLLQWLVFLWRDRTVVTIHGILDLTTVDKHFIRSNDYKVPVWAVKLAYRLIHVPLVHYAQKIIVHEQHFKDILVRQYGASIDKVVVIPHGIEAFNTIDRHEARRQLQLSADAHIVVFMGYATGYKGIDLLIEGFAEYAKTDPKAFLIIGAGEHPRVKETPEYRRKYAAWQAKAAQIIPSGQYHWEGFVAEKKITPFYSAADVAVFPYMNALASSGPMSMAIGHGRAFLASRAFAGIFDDTLLFDKTPTDMAQRLHDFFAHRNDYDAIVKDLRAERLWGRVAEQTVTAYGSAYNRKDDEIEERIIAG